MKDTSYRVAGLAWVCAVVAAVAIAMPAQAHDLNPPEYRGDPLSVHVHWDGTDPTGGTGGTGLPENPTDFSFVGDSNPEHILAGIQPQWHLEQGADFAILTIQVPNWIDTEPLKLLRLQITWTGNDAPAISGIDAFEGNDIYGGEIVHESPITPYTQPPGGYRYWDIEIRPNPDWEMIHIALVGDTVIDQIVVDSVSLPEPTSLALLLGGGGLVLMRRKSANCREGKSL